MIPIGKSEGARSPLRSASPFVGSLLFAVTAGVGPDADALQRKIADLGFHVDSSGARRETKEQAFRRLAQAWRRATEFSSSTTEIALQPDYQAIIGMGSDALPWILGELAHGHGHWFWALKAITGEDPVPPQDRGRIARMRQAWLDWGRQKGLLAT